MINGFRVLLLWRYAILARSSWLGFPLFCSASLDNLYNKRIHSISFALVLTKSENKFEILLTILIIFSLKTYGQYSYLLKLDDIS